MKNCVQPQTREIWECRQKATIKFFFATGITLLKCQQNSVFIIWSVGSQFYLFYLICFSLCCQYSFFLSFFKFMPFGLVMSDLEENPERGYVMSHGSDGKRRH